MVPLFGELDREASRTLRIPSSPLAPHLDPFHDQPQASCLFRQEKIMINGKRKLIRRVFISDPHCADYRHIGWVLYCDIHCCMICSRAFMRIVGKRQKHHCKICGNIVCRDCLTGMVRIKEIASFGYVEACSNCFWGQDEISIAQLSVPLAVVSSLEQQQSPEPKEQVPNLDFYTHLDIEEYEGPSPQGDSLQPEPSPLPFPPRLDSLCYSDVPSRWSETGSLAGEGISQSFLLSSEVPLTDGGRFVEVGRAGANEEEEEMADSEEQQDPSDEETACSGAEIEEPPLSQQTANQAQLMLLLMTLSLSNPSQLTEEEARDQNQRADVAAFERLAEEEELT
jgi:hypothetical protein